MYDLLDRSRNWPEMMNRDLVKRIMLELRSRDEPPAKEEPDRGSPRVRGDLFLQPRWPPPRPTACSVPAWEQDEPPPEGRLGETGDTAGDGQEDGTQRGLGQEPVGLPGDALES